MWRVRGLGKPRDTPVHGLRVEGAWAGQTPRHPCPWAACGGCVWRVRGLHKPRTTPTMGFVWRMRVEGAWPGRALRHPSVLWAGAPSHTAPDQGERVGNRRYSPASRSPAQHLVVTHPTQYEENTTSS